MGRLTLPRLRALYRYWSRHPPTHRLLAAYIGYEPPAQEEPKSATTPTDSGPARLPDWMSSGMSSIAAPVLPADASQEDVAGAFMTLFYGQMTTI